METKTMSVEEMNVAIARFEGRLFYGKYTIDKYGPGTGNAYPEMKYHLSWDWLMPVVQKIIATPMDTFDSYVLWLEDSLRTADIKQVYQAVWNYLESRPNNSHPSKVTGEGKIK